MVNVVRLSALGVLVLAVILAIVALSTNFWFSSEPPPDKPRNPDSVWWRRAKSHGGLWRICCRYSVRISHWSEDAVYQTTSVCDSISEANLDPETDDVGKCFDQTELARDKSKS